LSSDKGRPPYQLTAVAQAFNARRKHYYIPWVRLWRLFLLARPLGACGRPCCLPIPPSQATSIKKRGNMGRAPSAAHLKGSLASACPRGALAPISCKIGNFGISSNAPSAMLIRSRPTKTQHRLERADLWSRRQIDRCDQPPPAPSPGKATLRRPQICHSEPAHFN